MKEVNIPDKLRAISVDAFGLDSRLSQKLRALGIKNYGEIMDHDIQWYRKHDFSANEVRAIIEHSVEVKRIFG